MSSMLSGRLKKRFDNPLQQYWLILVKRRVAIGVCLVVTLLATWLYGESLAPVYRADAKLLIEDSTKWLGLKDTNRLSMDWYMTQFQILKSRPIITKVIERLDLTRQYWYSPSRLENLRGNLLGVSVAGRRAVDQEALIPLLQGSISVRPQTATGLVNLVVQAPSPALARDIANGLVQIFIEENLQTRIQLSMAATEYLTQRLSKISEEIHQKQQAVDDFEKLEGIEITQIAASSQQIADFAEKYVAARNERWETEERLKVLERVVQQRDFSGIQSPYLKETAVAPQSQKLFDAELRLDKLQKQGYLEKHPEVVAAREEIEDIKKRLVFESKAMVAGMRTDLAAQEQRERSLHEMIQELRPGAALESKKRVEYDFLKREVEIQQGFYESFNEQLKRHQLLDESSSTQIRVVESAAAPADPIAPNKRFNLAIGLFVGLVIGLFLAFLREYLDDTYKTADEIQDYLELPVVGTIPIINEPRDSQVPWSLDSSPLVTEAYRTLRTNLQFLETERPLKCLLVTSAGPGEGKSTTAANIALTLTQMGKRVCLVDSDLRRPVLHRLFQKPNRYGITSLFSGITDKRRLLVPIGNDNLYLLPCGPLPPNPAELLASKRMEEAVNNLRQDFDYIIFDSPPVLAVTDALVLSSIVDGVLLVVRAGETRISLSQKTLETLLSIKANVLGVVLNRVNPKQFGYYPYYSKYYGQGGKPGRTEGGSRRDRKTPRPVPVATPDTDEPRD